MNFLLLPQTWETASDQGSHITRRRLYDTTDYPNPSSDDLNSRDVVLVARENRRTERVLAKLTIVFFLPILSAR